ncbi:MAG: methylated-DNA--[protein]-cysteine S-methyltransferase [Actinobacteria bacterium]|nr:MAG: methylated-DNA--[protein]-cysteine S-methyltransferase [Actinomycetota bacterium]
MATLEETLARARLQPVREAAARDAARFVKAAEKEDLIDVAFARVASPFGELLVASTPRGVVQLSLHGYDQNEALEELARKVSPRIFEAPGRLDDVRRELDEYFTGKRKSFDLPLDWQLSHGFALRVLKATARIPYGRVSSYREMAEKAGNVRATRAAGNALGGNAIPVIVPCHRVLRTGGGLGGYGGGLPMKEALLRAACTSWSSGAAAPAISARCAASRRFPEAASSLARSASRGAPPESEAISAARSSSRAGFRCAGFPSYQPPYCRQMLCTMNSGSS